jgi:hypothetical protein
MQVADRDADRTTATLTENGELQLHWQLHGSNIIGPAPWGRHDLRAFSCWKAELAPDVALRAAMLRRAVMVSGARRMPADVESHAVDRAEGRRGACFTYQSPQLERAVQAPSWRRDFSNTSDQPLQDFDPVALAQAGEGAR